MTDRTVWLFHYGMQYEGPDTTLVFSSREEAIKAVPPEFSWSEYNQSWLSEVESKYARIEEVKIHDACPPPCECGHPHWKHPGEMGCHSVIGEDKDRHRFICCDCEGYKPKV